MSARGHDEVYLQPGQYWFGGGPVRLRTLLGSCVAITLWHPQRRLGGMCHFLLPAPPPSRAGGARGLPDGRYATEAMRWLAARAGARGLRCREFEAKLFGAGRMFQAGVGEGGVQEGNIAIARELLARHRVPLRAEHLGGDGHRHLLFDIATGEAWMRHTPLRPATVPRAMPLLAEDAA